MISQNPIENTMKWLRRAELSEDVLERVLRLTEEVIELGQAHGMTATQARDLVTQVYANEPGDIHQERGGVAVCLAAYCGVTDTNLWQEWLDEHNRINNDETIAKIREKHSRKVTTV